MRFIMYVFIDKQVPIPLLDAVIFILHFVTVTSELCSLRTCRF